MFCSSCGCAIAAHSKFCSSCGAELSVGRQTRTPGGESPTASNEYGALSPAIRAELKKFERHSTLTCLECGYRGLMGVITSQKTPWFLSYWIWIPLALVIFAAGYAVGAIELGWPCVFVGVAVSTARTFFLSSYRKEKLSCPSCLRLLISKK
ncbi:zinc-ribbon domain-containing protein [Paraburkholderia caledonica]|uniref:zinc-ribbon domain-containing protein n=1 Tax=Paraburkholderia caledonica TaxID=134536 RepID=UPI0038BB98A4